MAERRFIALIISGLFLISVLSLFPSASFEPLQQTDENSAEGISEDQILALQSLSSSVKVSGRTGDSTTSPWGYVAKAGGSSNDFVDGIAVDLSGNAYVIGTFSYTATFGSTSLTSSGDTDIFIAKLSSSGSWQWAVKAGGSNSEGGFGIAVDPNGYAYATGFFEGTATFGSTSLTSSGGSDIFIAKLSSSGEWQWAVKAGGSSVDFGNGIAVDSSGNAYVTGHFSGTATFGSTSLTSSGSYDILIAKLSSTGSWQWAVKAGSSYNDMGNGIAVDSTSNAYVTGYFSGTVSFGSTTLTNSGPDGGIFIAKLSSSGEWQWAVNAGRASGDLVNRIAVDSNGNAYVTESFFGTVTFGSTSLTSSGDDDIFIAKLSTIGEWQWAVKAGGPGDSDRADGIAVDSSGNAYVTGTLTGTATFGSTSLTSSGGSDIFIAKLSSSGEWQWAVKAGGSYDDFAKGIAVDSSGNAYVTGTLTGTATFGSTSLTSSGGYDIFIAIHQDQDGDGMLNYIDSCSDGDIDWESNSTSDYDLDGCQDSGEDDDDDNDGLTDDFDDCPKGDFGWTLSPSTDHDSDGCKDSGEDDDDDNDGLTDGPDDCPRGNLEWTSNPSTDHDGDGCQDSIEDNDDDNDGIADSSDACSKGALGWTSDLSTDYDDDGCQDSGEDDDDDNDGLTDDQDDCNSGNSSWTSKSSTDHDSDGCQDLDEDLDDDNDRVDDLLDLCPHGQLGWFSSSSTDFDSDGCLDSSEDVDDDNDGVLDAIEINSGTDPLDAASKPIDSFSVVVGNIELSTWDLIGIMLATLTSGFLAFAFVTRKGRYNAFSADIGDAQYFNLSKLEKKLELASFFRLLSPRQSIKLESLLDARKEDLEDETNPDESDRWTHAASR